MSGEIVYLKYVVMQKKRSFGAAVYDSLDSEKNIGPETTAHFERFKRDISVLLEQIRHNEREILQLNLTGEGGKSLSTPSKQNWHGFRNNKYTQSGQTVMKPMSPRKFSSMSTNNGSRVSEPVR